MECSNALLHAKTKGCIAGFSGSIGFTTDGRYAKIKAAPHKLCPVLPEKHPQTAENGEAMIYHNPVLKGFYPDPSVCCANGMYYMVCSSFQYFPGVPLFESKDLVNWSQIGHVLTRPSQVALEQVPSSGGVFAPTIRHLNGRFYMVTTNASTGENFYVYTDDIHGAWSDPVTVAQDGIDPSLYFEAGNAYFMSNGTDADGVNGVVQCQIDLATGEKLSPSRCIWQGSGGRFLESPHLYRIGDWYYLMAAEGGTEYGHMITYARSKSLWGPFTGYPHNPVLTNRNKAPYPIQGIGHGDLVQDARGNWHILSLGFRQQALWMAFHHLGREVFLTPVTFDEEGWFTAGTDGTTAERYDIAGDFAQKPLPERSFAAPDWYREWCFLRHPRMEQYDLTQGSALLHGTEVTLDEPGSPTFIGLRQQDFSGTVQCVLELDKGEAGLTCYMSEQEHYEVALRRGETGITALCRLNIGGVHQIQKEIPLTGNSARLVIRMEPACYHFSVVTESGETHLGTGQSKYLSSEISSPFTGVILGLYAVEDNTVRFTDFSCIYTET